VARFRAPPTSPASAHGSPASMIELLPMAQTVSEARKGCSKLDCL
jgi:hypothetical protein